jgi:integrative and conjugative element protein (TIGR02256 family)
MRVSEPPTTKPVPCTAVSDVHRHRVVLGSHVLTYVSAHRQLRFYQREAGGQLFGSVTADEVTVVRATGPYKGDERSRYSYRSNPTAAQRQIEFQAKKGLLYVGEWHTHAEDVPNASGSDHSAIDALWDNSSLNLNEMLLLIVGRHAAPHGLGLWSFGATEPIRWRLGV